MATSVETLVDHVRIESGLRNNKLFSDQKIVDRLNDAFAALRDLLIARFAYWFRAEYDFSLAGGADGNILDLVANVPDLEMIQGLFLRTSSGELQRVDLMSSIQEIGFLNNSYMAIGGDWSFNGFVGRKYFPDGNNLYVYPTANASGNYRLIYTPQQQPLALSISREFVLDPNDTPLVPAPLSFPISPGAWALANAGFTSDIPIDETAILRLVFNAPNETFSGAYPIQGISGPDLDLFSTVDEAGVSNLTSSAGFTGPASGTGSYTYQPVGTIGSLPQQLTQWQRYLVLYASIVIRQSRRQPMQDLELQFQQIEARIKSIAKQRSEGVRQAPITRGRNGFFGGGFGY